MKKHLLALSILLLMTNVHAQLPPINWSVAQDTITENVFHYHKNLAISNSGLSAALTSRNDVDRLEVFETDGSLRYSKGFAEDMVWYYHVDFDAEDGLYLTGTNQPGSTQGSSMRVQKLDPQGNELWTLNWQENSQDYTGVIRTHLLNDDRLIVCGQFNFYNANSTNDFYIACINPTGSMDWTYIYSSPGVVVDILRNSQIDSENNIYFTGVRQNPDISSFYNLIAGKLTSDGNLAWSVDLDYSSFEGQSVDAASITADSNGNVLVGANTYTYSIQGIPISIPLIARLDGNTGNTLNISHMEFDRNTVLKEVINDNDGHYYCNFYSSLDSLIGGPPGPIEFVTYERAHHVQKRNSSDELIWTHNETASDPTYTVETYNMIWHDNQLLVFHYLNDQNKISVLSTSGTLLDSYSYAKHVIHVGTYQHHILANAYGVFLLTGSLQTSQFYRPYYWLVQFGFDPDFIYNSSQTNHFIYPNPATNFIHIPGLKNTTAVRLFTSSGQHVEVRRDETQIYWNLLPPGAYLLELKDNNQLIHQRLIIQ
jgi:Secretion system C-terminal sorting domain/Domain of unknown function (DUF5122) beta-propeller